ncbi:unnamed protein product [Sphagnum compactum]
MGEMRLECLVLKHTDIILIRGHVKVRFATLASLTLWDIRVSAMDLHGLLLACPELENLSLNRVFDICSSEARVPLELTRSSLKSFTWQNWTGDWTGPKLVAEKLESLHLKDNENPSHLHVVTKGNLQEVRIENSLGTGLKIEGDFHLLHVLDFHSPWFDTCNWSDFMVPFQEAPNLREPRLWPVQSYDPNLERIAVFFPCLSQLSLLYNFEDATQVEKLLEGSSILEKVVLLELGCLTVSSLFDQWISRVVQRCPNLRNHVVHCGVSQLKFGMNTLQMLDKRIQHVQLSVASLSGRHVIWLAYSRIRVLGLTKMNHRNNNVEAGWWRYAWYIELDWDAMKNPRPYIVFVRQECLYVWELQEAVGVLALTSFCELNPTGDYIC